MTTSYLPYHPDQAHLLPVSASDWLPEGHLAYFIADTVESLDLSAFHARYAKGGPRKQPFHPAMMVKVLLYGYATGVFSSRKLAKRLHEDVALRVLAAGNFPAHRTLSDFRALHLEELSALFVQVVKLARECGRVKLGTIAVDGTKVKARLQARQREADMARGRHAGDERKPRHPDGTPKKCKPFTRDFGVPDDADQTNFTDPPSRIMKQSNKCYDHSYNAQTAVDEAHQIIVAAELTDCAADSGQLPVMAEAVQRTVGALPQRLLADAGYCSEAALAALASCPCEVIVALGREGRENTRIDAVKYPHTASIARTLKSEAGKAAYRRRKAIVEAPNGWIKSVLGFRQFSLRGLQKVRAEWKLVCLALNLQRMATMVF